MPFMCKGTQKSNRAACPESSVYVKAGISRHSSRFVYFVLGVYKDLERELHRMLLRGRKQGYLIRATEYIVVC